MSEREIVCQELSAALDDLRGDGFRLDVIYPADDPHTALLSKGEESVRLTNRPGGLEPPEALPPFVPEFVITRAGGTPGTGRAGMLYRDLIPSRLGGRYIVSHISIPEGGPVGDWVHFHRIAFQMIYVRRGWVRVVYRGPGQPIRDARRRFRSSAAGNPSSRPRKLIRLRGRRGRRARRFMRHSPSMQWACRTPRIVAGSMGSALSAPHRGRHAVDAIWRRRGAGKRDSRGDRRHCRRADDPRVDGKRSSFPLTGASCVRFRPRWVGDPRARRHARAECRGAFVIPPGGSWRVTGASAGFRLLHVTTARLD